MGPPEGALLTSSPPARITLFPQSKSAEEAGANTHLSGKARQQDDDLSVLPIPRFLALKRSAFMCDYGCGSSKMSLHS